MVDTAKASADEVVVGNKICCAAAKLAARESKGITLP